MKIIQNYSKLSRIIQNYSELFRIIQNSLELFKIIQNYSELFKIMQDYAELFRIIPNYSKLFRIIQNYSEFFRIIQKSWESLRIVFCRISDPRRHSSRPSFDERRQMICMPLHRFTQAACGKFCTIYQDCNLILQSAKILKYSQNIKIRFSI